MTAATPPIKTTGRKPVIGLIGGIGAGKSMVARELASGGCAVIDADDLAKAAMERPEVREQLVQWWGQQVIGPQGNVDRRAVGKIVFSDPQQLRRLEQLIHPRVHQERLRLRDRHQNEPKIVAIVEDCPLLLETGLDRQCDKLIFVKSSRGNRLKRLAANRGWSDQELDRRENLQLGLDKKSQRADYIVDNDGSPQDCCLQVRRVLSQILQGSP